MQNNQQSLLDNFTNAGPTDQGTIINLPDTGATVHKAPKHTDPLRGVVASLNANRDLNVTHDFDFWSVRDAEIGDWEAFNAIHRKVLANRQHFSNFSGDPAVDFTNLTPAEIQYYSDFLGGFFKKVGHAIGSAAKSAVHAVGWAGKEIGHGVAWTGKEVGHLVSGAEHGIVHGAVGAAHILRDGVKDVGHGVGWVAKEGVHLHKLAEKETGKIFKAVAPYWKDILAVAGTVVLAATGIGLPIAIAAGGALLTGLNQIPNPEPELPAGFGAGAGMGGAESGSGFPEGATPDDDDDTGDTGEGLTPADQARNQQATADYQQQQAEIEAAAKKKKLMIWGGAIVAAIIVIYFIRRK